MPKNLLKKAQIQMGESTTIVIIVIILLVIGFSFYAYLQSDNIRKDRLLMEEYHAVQLSLTASNVPELLCSTKGVVDSNCYDYLKVMALKKLIEDSRAGTDKSAFFYYSDLFGSSEINITIIHPSEENILLYSQPDAAKESHSMMRIPVVVYNALENKNMFGLIIIKKYY